MGRPGGRGRGPAAVRRALRAYRRSLSVLPRDFRRAFGAELEASFEAIARDAHARAGAAGLVMALLRGTADVLAGAVRERVVVRARHRGDSTRAARGRLRTRTERVTDMLNELRLAVRALARRPGFAAVAAMTLALGIGANVAIFTVVDAVLLEPLPYPESDRIVVVRHHAPGLNLPELENSAGTIEYYRESARTITRMAAVDERTRNLAGLTRPDRVEVVAVTPEFFDVFATRPALGRGFEDVDVAEGAARVLILLHDAWRTRYGGDAAIVGRTVLVDGASAEIVGVMPRAFAWRNAGAVALEPLQLDPQRSFGTFGRFGVARLAPGADLAAARQEITAMQLRLTERFPELTQSFLDQAGWQVSVRPLKELLIEDIRPALWVLLGTVGLVLLIAGANVANLFLVRAEARQREVAVRSALGAGRRRLAKSFLTESLVLSGAGTVAGVLLAYAGVRALVTRGPEGLPRLHEVGMDASVFGFTLLLGLLAAGVLAVVPLARYAGLSFANTLREGGRGNTAGRSRHRARQALIAGQVALALVLLVGSGLMLRSAIRLRAVDPGFVPGGVLTAGVSLGTGTSRAADAVFYQHVLDALAGLPGVEAAGAANALPIEMTGLNGSSFHIESRPRPEDQLPPVAMYAAVMPGFLETLQVPLLAGRGLDRRDQDGGRPVVVVNQTLATRFLDGNAIGERLRFGDDEDWVEIVGVVGDVRTFGLNEDIRPMAYMPITTRNRSVTIELMKFVLRTSGDPGALAPAVRRAVEGVDATVPVTAVRTLDDVVAASLAENTFTTLLLMIASVVALLLGVIGLYGVISYVVGQRTQEIGVRIALGAQPAAVRGMVLRQGMVVTVAGVLLGLAAALGASRLLSSLLFEVSARDPLTFAVVAALLLGVSLAATWLPARRAAAVDPLVALREE